MFSLYLLSVLLLVTAIGNSSGKLISVYRTTPRTDEHLHFLHNLTFTIKNTLFWRDPETINRTVDIMVHNSDIHDFKTLMNRNNLDYHLKLSDLKKLLENSLPHKHDRRKKQNGFGWRRFHNLNEIYYWLDSLAQSFPRNVRIIEAGRSYEGRSIKGVHIRFGQKKPGIFIESGIHAREWIAPATATYLINELLRSSNSGIRWLARSFDWYVFPSVNPDGYAFTHINPQDPNYRLWRKTRSPGTSRECSRSGCYNRSCYGSDLNRNWNFYWGGPGSSRDACSEIYAGSKPFSEIEIWNLAQYIRSISGDLFAYISLHSYIQKLMFPYGHTSAHLDNYNQEFEVGRQAVNALSRRYGTRYQLGNIYEVIGGPSSGSSLDWVKSTFKLPFVYCYELRGQTSSGEFYGFVPPPSEIIPNGQEVMDSLEALFQAAVKTS